MGASTPHFALQLRERIRALIRGLPADHPARIEGEREIARLDKIAFSGEVRGHPAEAGADAAAERHAGVGRCGSGRSGNALIRRPPSRGPARVAPYSPSVLAMISRWISLVPP